MATTPKKTTRKYTKRDEKFWKRSNTRSRPNRINLGESMFVYPETIIKKFDQIAMLSVDCATATLAMEEAFSQMETEFIQLGKMLEEEKKRRRSLLKGAKDEHSKSTA